MFFLKLLLSSMCAWAQVGTAVDALGGAGLGATQPFEAAVVNPAALTVNKAVFAGVQSFSGPVMGTTDMKQQSVIIIDSNSEAAFPGAITYRYRDYDVGGRALEEQVFQASGGFGLGSDFAVGASAYYIKSDSPSALKDLTQKNMDLYAFWVAMEGLNVGATVRGVFGSKDTAAVLPSQVLPSAGVGLEYTMLSFVRVRADIHQLFEKNPDHYFQHNLGLELRHLDYVALRVGINGDDGRGQTRLTAGIAWEGPKLKAGYAYQKENRQDLGDSHTVDIWFNF